MPIDPINTDYDKANDGSAINWEEHKGLATKVARIMCSKDRRLEPHFDDIVTDLWLVLWKCALPENFSRDKARYSTYACRSMLNTYEDMCTMYLGYNSRRKYNGSGNVSIYHPVRGGLRFIDIIPAKEDPSVKCVDDYMYAYNAVTWIVGKKRMEAMIDPVIRRKSPSSASDAKRAAIKTIQNMRLLNPARIEELEASLGVVA